MATSPKAEVNNHTGSLGVTCGQYLVTFIFNISPSWFLWMWTISIFSISLPPFFSHTIPYKLFFFNSIYTYSIYYISGQHACFDVTRFEKFYCGEEYEKWGSKINLDETVYLVAGDDNKVIIGLKDGKGNKEISDNVQGLGLGFNGVVIAAQCTAAF